MPINPCGAFCDWGRRPYRTRARFRAGDPTETGIRWYICDHDARPLPFPSAIVNTDWENNDLERDYTFDPQFIGEVGTADRVAAFRDQPQGHTGGHQCGEPSWYVKGLPSNPPGVPVIYNADGLPICCAPGEGIMWGNPPPLADGGMAWGEPGETWPFGEFFFFSAPFPNRPLDATFVPGFWQYADGFDTYQLVGPLYTGTDEWRAYVSVSLGPFTQWHTTAWDGTGTRSFDWVSGALGPAPLPVIRTG